MNVGACAQINVLETINQLVGNVWLLTIFFMQYDRAHELESNV